MIDKNNIEAFMDGANDAWNLAQAHPDLLKVDYLKARGIARLVDDIKENPNDNIPKIVGKHDGFVVCEHEDGRTAIMLSENAEEVEERLGRKLPEVNAELRVKDWEVLKAMQNDARTRFKEADAS